MRRQRWWNIFSRTIGMKGLVYSALAIAVGSLIGLGVFTFGYANGFAYFGSDPKTCANCHAMNGQYAGWLKGSHKNVAGCNDCHGRERLLALAQVHDAGLPDQHSDQAPQQAGHRRRVPVLPRKPDLRDPVHAPQQRSEDFLYQVSQRCRALEVMR